VAGTLDSLVRGLSPRPRSSSSRDLRALYREAARMHHPDRGGSARAMAMTSEAYRNRDERRLRALVAAGHRLRGRG